MYLLPCTQCQTSIPVSPSQAGDKRTCSQCKTEVSIPKLGILRQLPQSEEQVNAGSKSQSDRQESFQIPFVALFLLALCGFLVGGFCGIRWSLILVPKTTDQHVEEIRTTYAKQPAAELIREYEQMVGDGIELGVPFDYKRFADEKARWGIIATISVGVGLLAIVAAFWFAALGRRRAES